MRAYGVDGLETIRSEYRRINEKWLGRQYRLMLWLMAFTVAAEVVMAFVLQEMGFVSATVQRYMLKYVLAPLVCNLALAGAAALVMRSRGLTVRQRTYGISLLMAGMAFMVYTIHSVFLSLYLVMAIPMLLTVVYGDQRLTDVTGLCCILGKAVSDLFLFWDPDRRSVFHSSETLADFWLSLLILMIFYGACRAVNTVEQEKNDVSIALERERLRLLEQSMTDELTKVWNRQALREGFCQLERLPQEAEVYLAMLDLDDFKGLNDAYGHSRGDVYLQALGQALLACAGEGIYPFRYGGDEFCIFVLGRGQGEVEALCRRAQVAFQAAEVNRTFQAVSFSVGVAKFHPGEAPTRLLERADAALYRAKQERGSIWFDTP